MTQRSVEATIGKLVLDEDFRATFRSDRQEAIRQIRAEGFDLNPIEIRAIEALDPSDVERLASVLDPRLRKASLRRRTARGRGAGAFLLAIATVASAPAGPATAAPLTLQEAIDAALAGNREIRDAGLQIDHDNAALAEAKTRRLPSMEIQAIGGQSLTSLSVTVPGGALGTYPGTGPIPATDTKISSDAGRSAFITASVAQPLTQLHAVGLSVRLGEKSVALQREELRARRVAVVTEVKEAYFGILRTESALEAAAEQRTLLLETRRVVGELVERESALKSEAMDVETGIAAQDLRILGLRNEAASYREQLNEALGRDLATPFDVVPVPDEPADADDLESARQHALADRPEIRQARLRIDQADLQRRVTKAEYIPDLSLAVSYLSYFGMDLLPSNVAQAGLQLKWQPFDWGRGKRLAAASVRAEQARNDVPRIETRIALEVGRAFRALAEARAQLRVRRLAREAAVEKARVAVNRQREEASLLQATLEARSALADADTQYQQALLGYWAARVEFERAIGEEA